MKYRFVKWGSGTGRQGDRETGGQGDRELVSYGDDTQWFHARQETIREQFPMEVIRSVPTTDRKLFAKGFLWR